MINLNLYPIYKSDIQNKHTNIYPLLIIDNDIFISTVKEVIDGNTYFDYGLQISNIKESADIIKRKFKVSNVTVKLNNYGDSRFSDVIYNYLNKDVEIYYKSQSCNSLSDCLPVYKGVLKDFKYNEKTVSLTLEDKSEIIFQKDVPVANLGYSDNLYSSKYINREIPITYGRVSKAPAVLYKDGSDSEGRIHIISDNIFGLNNEPVEITGFGTDDLNPEQNEIENVDSPLYIYKDNYFNVLPDASNEPDSLGIEFDSRVQFSVSDDLNSLYIDKEFELDFPKNPPAQNMLECARVIFPNDIKLLKGEAGDTFTSYDELIVSLADTTIQAKEAAIDNPNTQNNLIVNEDNFLSTFAQLPDNQPNEENIDDLDNIVVHEFIPHLDGGFRKDKIWYPKDEYHFDEFEGNMHRNYGCEPLWKQIAWLWSSAHNFDEKIQFVEFPCADLVKARLEEQLEPMGITLKSGRSHYFRLQTRTPILKEHWENFNDYELPYSDSMDIFSSNYKVYDYKYEALHNHNFPSAVYTFMTTDDTPIFVGQWNSISKYGASADLVDGTVSLFFNIFPEDNNFPHLFEVNEFATFTPILKTYEDSNNSVYGMKYQSKYNGVPIGTLNDSSTGSTCIIEEEFSAGFDYEYGDEDDSETISDWSWGYQKQNRIKSTELCNKNSSSWCMYFSEGINGGAIMTEQIGDRAYSPDLDCMIKSNTFIPLNHRQLYNPNGSGPYATGYGLDYDYYVTNTSNQISIGSGSADTAGEKLLITLPMTDVSAFDSIQGKTRTYAYGKIHCVFNPDGLESPNTDSGNQFRVHLAATKIERDDEGSLINEHINFTSSSDFNAILIDEQGGDNLNESVPNDGNDVYWSTATSQGDNTFDEIGVNKIEAWDSPSKFNGVTLAYSLIGTESKLVSFKTNVFAVGIMQFIGFENALDDEIYVDTMGRANTAADTNQSETLFKYTDDIIVEDSKQIIENPADIMYHFIEKELGAVDITNRDSWREARNSTNIKLGFSVKEKINSKELIEAISNNCNIVPRFRQDGNFAFTNIKNTYNSVDVTIKKRDIVSFGLEHTKLSNIYTLVNVKYKKDYAKDEYTKQTGYCDGYDFFGNGDNGYSGGYKYELYGLRRDENILEYESDYIRDKDSALALRDFIYLNNCNRHTIASVKLPLKYSHLELGDVIRFDELINNMKSFGEDYTSNNITRNGQTIYPYFIITSITKNPKNISIKATQLHKLERNFNAGVGSLSRMSQASQGEVIADNLNISDWNILYDIILNAESEANKYITSEQKKNADINSNGTINLNDLNVLGSLMNLYNGFQVGDVNQDGNIDVSDIIMILSYLLGEELTETEFELADFNQGGDVSVIDIVGILNYILTGE